LKAIQFSTNIIQSINCAYSVQRVREYHRLHVLIEG